MMAMIGLLSFTLAADPRQAPAWRTLLLSKAASSVLFILFAAVERNSIFIVASLVDGAILLHLAWLSLGSADLADPWQARSGILSDCVHETWFLKANDPATRDALWLRYTLDRGPAGLEGRLWYAVFDAKERRVLSGVWSEAESGACHGSKVCRLGESALSRDAASCDSPDVSWRLRWKSLGAPAFCFVRPWLHLWGVAGTAYASPLPAALFEGEVRVHGRAYTFSAAPGSVGHLWGRRRAETWRWLHAVFPDKEGGRAAVVEILSARGRLGPFVLPRLTLAHLWSKGRHRTTSLLGSNRTWPLDGGWGFSLEFPGCSATGSCAPDPRLTAEFDYHDNDGRTLLCRNSKAGSLAFTMTDRADGGSECFETRDSAAVETVETLT
jgi:hypothetical protein